MVGCYFWKQPQSRLVAVPPRIAGDSCEASAGHSRFLRPATALSVAVSCVRVLVDAAQTVGRTIRNTDRQGRLHCGKRLRWTTRYFPVICDPRCRLESRRWIRTRDPVGTGPFWRGDGPKQSRSLALVCRPTQYYSRTTCGEGFSPGRLHHKPETSLRRCRNRFR
jgi:hypothetical protein